MGIIRKILNRRLLAKNARKKPNANKVNLYEYSREGKLLRTQTVMQQRHERAARLTQARKTAKQAK